MSKQKAVKLTSYPTPDVLLRVDPPAHGRIINILHAKDVEIIGTLDAARFQERFDSRKPYPTEREIMELVEPAGQGAR